jgi:hypothetical protein
VRLSPESIWSAVSTFGGVGDVPAERQRMDMEYEEAPRGTVIYNTKTQRFTLADRNTFRDQRVVRQITSEQS